MFPIWYRNFPQKFVTDIWLGCYTKLPKKKKKEDIK